MHVVRQLVAQRLADRFVVSVAIVCVGPEAQLDDFTAVAVQAERTRGPFMGAGSVFDGIHFREEWNSPFVFAHGRFDAWIVFEAL